MVCEWADLQCALLLSFGRALKTEKPRERGTPNTAIPNGIGPGHVPAYRSRNASNSSMISGASLRAASSVRRLRM